DSDLHLRQVDVVSGHVGAAGPVIAVGDTRVLALQIPLPAMEGALDFADAAGTRLQLTATMRAHIVESLNSVRSGSDHDRRLVIDVIGDIPADLGYLLQAARDLPDARPQALVLEVGELKGGVMLLGNEVTSDRRQFAMANQLSRILRRTVHQCSPARPAPLRMRSGMRPGAAISAYYAQHR